MLAMHNEAAAFNSFKAIIASAQPGMSYEQAVAHAAQVADDAAHHAFDSDCDLALVPAPQPVAPAQVDPEWVTLHVVKGTVDGDITMVPFATYAQVAQRFANDHKMVVGIRCSTTSRHVAVVQPVVATTGNGKTGKSKEQVRYDFEARVLQRKADEAHKAFTDELARATKSASPKSNSGSPRVRSAGGTNAPKAPRQPKTAPTVGTIEYQIIQLALRPEGVSAGELNDLTNWHNAPWKWNFGNKNGNGYTNRYDGYAYYQTEVLPEGGKGRKVVKHHLVYRDEAWFAAHDEAHGVTQADEPVEAPMAAE